MAGGRVNREMIMVGWNGGLERDEIGLADFGWL